MKEREYSVRVDGFEITRVTLEPEQYRLQRSRDEVRRAIAATYQIPTHYIRLCPLEGRKYRWDKEKEKNVPI